MGPNPKTSGLKKISVIISEDTAARKEITSKSNSPGEVLQRRIKQLQDSDVEVQSMEENLQPKLPSATLGNTFMNNFMFI